MTQPATLVRRSLGAVAASVLLGAAAVPFASPERASAAYGTCGAGDFCLYYANNLPGGVYHVGGSDSNLDNDRFEGGHTNTIVGNNAMSALNQGVPAAKSDVVIYTMTRYRGASACIVLGDRGELPVNWWNTIESYRWVTRNTCNMHVRIDLR